MSYSTPGGSGVGGRNDYLPENESETKRLIGSSVVLIALSTIFVLLRLVSRKVSKAGFWVTYCAFRNIFYLFLQNGLMLIATNIFMLLVINSGMMRRFYLLWCVGSFRKKKEDKKIYIYPTHVAKSRSYLMAFLLEILLVNSARHLNGRAMVTDDIYSRYPVRIRRTHKVAEELLRIANILCHVRLRRQVFHVSAHILNQTLATPTPPPSVSIFFPQSLPDMPFLC